MSYRFVYPNGGAPVGGFGMDPTMMPTGYPNMYHDHRRSFSPESFSSSSESSDDYEYRGRIITRERRHPRDVVRAPTPPPIIKRVVERAPTPEPTIMERIIIRPQAQEIVERVIEQPYTPPPRVIQKEMHEQAPPPIVRTRVIKINHPVRVGHSQPCSPFEGARSYVGSVGRPAVFSDGFDNSPSFSSTSSFEYMPPAPPPTMMMMMMMPRPAQMQSCFGTQNYMYPVPRHGMSFGYRPMMQQGRMIPSGMPMMTHAMPTYYFPTQRSLFHPMAQQLVY